jgi:CcmD family protein
MNPIYVVLSINLIVWTGIFGYIVYLNKEINRLKSELKKTLED